MKGIDHPAGSHCKVWILSSHKQQAAGRCCTLCSGYVFTARPPFPRGASSPVRIDLAWVEGQKIDVKGNLEGLIIDAMLAQDG